MSIFWAHEFWDMKHASLSAEVDSVTINFLSRRYSWPCFPVEYYIMRSLCEKIPNVAFK